MFFSFIARLFGAKPAAPPAAVPTARRKAVVAATAMAPSAPTAPLPVIGARRPLVDVKGRVAGFEFFVAHATRERLLAQPDIMVQRAHFTALLGSMRLCAQSGQLAYAELPASWLMGKVPESAERHQFGLQGFSDVSDASALAKAVKEWRTAGAKFGWRKLENAPPGLRPDFVVCTTALPPDGMAWVAPDMPDVDTLETALRTGANWAGSAVRASAEPREVRALPPQARRLMRLLNQLVRDDDSAAVVSEIKDDAALSVRLLQHLNSPGVSRGHTLVSIDQAVAVLGRDALYHWISGLLVRLAPARPAAASLQAQALWRAHLLEMVGRAAGEPQPGSLYLMGLVSLLPLLMQVSLSDALGSMQLPELAERALLQRDGAWSGYLALVEAFEKPDLVAARALAAPVGGLDAMMAMSSRAWQPA